ncbi:taf5-like RNA polymerase II, p300/CBP-associated factor (PCAF)-associated factor, 65kDa, related [Neospora caninum Liverpool]|uniref:TAF5-like RNA polymerase II, p300/CBP-associated factor (PCAF)-associated factor, 65kDa, related n=1 Tax=Neospora caninum (strain Liverpool) TaxID=572307 RepID=F0VAG9_NEOCL|nr:taf5-like RNA polymerase II, p300/CBP-associated factor (PCAF)-associated factor, 65kDa, related [Neospora caninum Liverpool]CBZ50658.1 taf5-like RNA polymerase II, p300/CBP-associated factor (PCAF)-associated factor, 65kDa, related [Neospora caninum Liverpool]CEL65269.1 TPA: TAF5-like RNA polymerase II, p300/CBP-associated factor (PCAF)-associated factor, 65kDa, related [Neospora caninum Liverpool]|eukprot:XP_003880691.1 taf5-like RNA polymerase II, p300/CBP-associated factor (PCAF)-associated factor, 65kDa, related [Neospora caninum Liverpool]
MADERPVSFPPGAQHPRETMALGESPPCSSASSFGDAPQTLPSFSPLPAVPPDPRGEGAAPATLPAAASSPNKLAEIFQLLQEKYHVDSRMLDSLQKAIASSTGAPSPSSSVTPQHEQLQASVPQRASAEAAAMGALGTLGGLSASQAGPRLALPGGTSLLSFDVYERIYSRFCVWILSLFEDCREELMDVAFAVLLHMFRKLLSIDAYQARQLLRRFSLLHAGKHGPLLKQIEDAEPVHPLQLSLIPYFASDERHPLYISERAYFVLRTWLVDTRCLLLEVMIQAASRLLPPPPHAPHLRGVVYPGLLAPLSQSLSAPAPTAPQAHPLSSLPAGLRKREETPEPAAQEKAAAQRASDLAFFDARPTFTSPQLGETERDRGEKREDERLSAEADLPPVTWGLPRQFFREETTVVGPGGERTKRVRLLGGENLRESDLAEPNSLLPLPEPSKDSFLLYKRLLKQQTERRAPLSAAAGQWPSIACMTVLNSSCESSCCAVSPSTCKLIAVGGEGEIRLWDLQQYQVTKARRERQRRKWLLRMQQQAQEGRPLSSFPAGPPGADDEDRTSSESEEEDAVGAKAPNAKSELRRRKKDAAASAPPLALEWGEDAEGEEGVSRLVGTDGRVLALAFGEIDDRILLSGGTDGVIRLWQSYPFSSRASSLVEDEAGALDGEEKKLKAQGEAEEAGAGRDSPDGERLSDERHEAGNISGGRSNVVSPLCVYRGALAAVWSLDVGPYGHYFASGSSDNCARLWCTSRSFPVRLLQHSASATDVFHVAFHPNSSLLLTAASDNSVRLFDLRSAQLARAWAPLLLPSVDGEARRRENEDERDGDRDETRGREDERERRERRERRGSDRKLEKHDALLLRKKRIHEEVKRPETKHLRLLGKRGLGAYGTHDEDDRRRRDRRRTGRVTTLAMSPNGRLAAVGDSAGGICVFDIPSGRPLAFGSIPTMQRREESSAFSSLHSRIAGLSFCHGSSLLASAAIDGTVALWDTSTGALPTPDGDGTTRQKPGLFAGHLPSLSLAETYGAAHVAFRSCLFTPENLLLCLGFSTLCSEEDFL